MDGDFGVCRNILLLLGWIAFAALAYIISQSEPIEMTVYNPYDILGLNPVSILPWGRNVASLKVNAKARWMTDLNLNFHLNRLHLI